MIINKLLKWKKGFASIFTMPVAQKYETKAVIIFLMTSLLSFMFVYIKSKSEQLGLLHKYCT